MVHEHWSFVAGKWWWGNTWPLLGQRSPGLPYPYWGLGFVVNYCFCNCYQRKGWEIIRISSDLWPEKGQQEVEICLHENPHPALLWSPTSWGPIGKGCLHSGPGRRDASPCAQRAGLSQLSTVWSGPECCWGPIPSVGRYWAFRFLFISCSTISTGTSQPAPPLPQTSAKPTRKTAKRDCHQLFFSGNILQ